jgi:hypothetical protein
VDPFTLRVFSPRSVTDCPGQATAQVKAAAASAAGKGRSETKPAAAAAAAAAVLHSAHSFRICLPNTSNFCFINATLQLLASSLCVQAVFEHFQHTSRSKEFLWAAVIHALGKKASSPSTLISKDSRNQLSKLVSGIEDAIPGHLRGTQNCTFSVLDLFFRDVRRIATHFGIKIQNSIICSHCNLFMNQTENHTLLPVFIRSRMSIQDGVLHFMRITQNKTRCCPCCCALGSKHQLKLLSAGNIFLVNVKKSSMHEIKDPLASIKIGLNPGQCYNLKAVVGYSGDGKFGHYWNYVIDEQGKHEVISDGQSRRATHVDIQLVAKCGVLFLYERRGADLYRLRQSTKVECSFESFLLYTFIK